MLNSGLEYAYCVAEEKSFSRAAEKMYVSQPALSAAIQKEEAYWGFSFFDRSKSPIDPTPEGAYLIGALKRIKSIQTEVENYFKELNIGRMNSISIGAPSFFCTYVLASVVKSFKKFFPDCKINIIEASDKDLFNSMHLGLLDCCISVEHPPSDLLPIPLVQEDILLAVPKTYEINKKLGAFYSLNQASLETKWSIKEDCPKVSIQEFKDYPFLLLSKGNDMHRRAYKIFSERKINPDTFMMLEQMMTSYHMAASGMGIAFVRANFLNCESTDLFFYAINSKYAIRGINLIIPKSKEGSSVLNAFLEHLKLGVAFHKN